LGSFDMRLFEEGVGDNHRSFTRSCNAATSMAAWMPMWN
jgi:hypothetical protein